MNLGLYIHIPFCHRRCTYCDFYLTTNLSLIDNFVDALIQEIKLYSLKYPGCTVDTVFFGGGTPSILTTNQFDKIIRSINNNFKILSSPEITIECNPEDILGDTSKFYDFKSIGANRISVGVQSFIDKELSFLTRLHNGSDAVKSLEISVSLFDNVSADLIYSFNGQELCDVKYNLNKFLELGLQHISAYTLILEKGTLLYKEYERKNLLKTVDSDNPQFYEFVNSILNSNGYNHYEVSNYAKNGFRSKHNLKYWDFDYYLGLGPSAHSFIGNNRFSNPKSLKQYTDKLSAGILPVETNDTLSATEHKNDYFISVLRCNGVNFAKYKQLFGSVFMEDFKIVAENILKLNLAVADNDSLKLNEKGFALADEITLGFLQ
ncbi:MAG: radical SAM family heme chaperone HemW [Ignavibacteriae bacterium]|nr:radical SAM family heme chaperone HemW [Ignavibacteriota bacterium]